MDSVYSKVFLLVSLLFSLNAFAAVKIVECEDEDGNRSFQKTCPPGSQQLSEKRISIGGSSASDEKRANIQAVLYVIPDCESCEEVKDFLGARNISYTEKDVSDDISLQNELTELTGALKVPTTIIGEEVLTGYSRSSFMDALTAVGYEEES